MKKPVIEKFGTISQDENGDVIIDGFDINFGDYKVSAENAVMAVKDYLDQQLTELEPANAFQTPNVYFGMGEDEISTQSSSSILDSIRESANNPIQGAR